MSTPTPSLLEQICVELCIAGDAEDVVAEAMAQLELPPSLGVNTRERVQLICDTLDITAEWEEEKSPAVEMAAGCGVEEGVPDAANASPAPRRAVSWGRMVVELIPSAPAADDAAPNPSPTAETPENLDSQPSDEADRYSSSFSDGGETGLGVDSQQDGEVFPDNSVGGEGAEMQGGLDAVAPEEYASPMLSLLPASAAPAVQPRARSGSFFEKSNLKADLKALGLPTHGSRAELRARLQLADARARFENAGTEEIQLWGDPGDSQAMMGGESEEVGEDGIARTNAAIGILAIRRHPFEPSILPQVSWVGASLEKYEGCEHLQPPTAAFDQPPTEDWTRLNDLCKRELLKCEAALKLLSAQSLAQLTLVDPPEGVPPGKGSSFRGSLRATLSEEQWESDKDVNECKQCVKKFSLSRRRHHCRLCGGIFCSACAKPKALEIEVPATDIMLPRRERVRACVDCIQQQQAGLAVLPEPEPELTGAQQATSATAPGMTPTGSTIDLQRKHVAAAVTATAAVATATVAASGEAPAEEKMRQNALAAERAQQQEQQAFAQQQQQQQREDEEAAAAAAAAAARRATELLQEREQEQAAAATAAQLAQEEEQEEAERQRLLQEAAVQAEFECSLAQRIGADLPADDAEGFLSSSRTMLAEEGIGTIEQLADMDDDDLVSLGIEIRYRLFPVSSS